MVSLFSSSKTESNTYKRNIFLSPGINLVLFGLFFSFFNPMYDTAEDVYILYKLSGGFGEAPTALVHYNHILHPLVGSLIAALFKTTNQVNWYTLMLIAGHFVSCTIILSRLLTIHSIKECFPFFLALFVVFECKFLSGINFTNTAIVLGCASVVALFATNNKAGFHFIRLWVILLLLVASFFRIHVLIPIVGVSLPFLLLVFRKAALANVITLAVAGLLVAGLNLVHQSYYEKRIPGWEQEEAYRQQLYQFYNNKGLYVPKAGEQWYREMAYINNGLPTDTSVLNSGVLNKMHTELKAKKSPSFEEKAEWYWFWINNRILFFTLLFVILFCGFKRELVMMEISSLVLLVLGMMALRYMGKFPDYLLSGCLLLLISLVLLKADFSSVFWQVAGRNLLMTMMVLWGIVQYYKLNQKNIAAIASFRSAAKAVIDKKDTLFIACSAFPLQKFYVFDVPAKYPLTNLLCTEHFLHQDYHAAFSRFGIGSIDELYKDPGVEFLQCDSSFTNSSIKVRELPDQ